MTLGALSRPSHIQAHSWHADRHPGTEWSTGHGLGRPEHPHPPREHLQTDNQGLRIGRGGRGDSGTGRPRGLGTQVLLHPAPVPWHLGPGPPPPSCSVCVTTPDTGLRAARPGWQWAVSFTASTAWHSSSSAPWTEKVSLLRAGNKRDRVLGCRGLGGTQQACAALNVSAGQCRDLQEMEGPALDGL